MSGGLGFTKSGQNSIRDNRNLLKRDTSYSSAGYSSKNKAVDPVKEPPLSDEKRKALQAALLKDKRKDKLMIAFGFFIVLSLTLAGLYWFTLAE